MMGSWLRVCVIRRSSGSCRCRRWSNFEAERAWLMTVANRKTVSGFLHVSWRTAGAVARRIAERVKASMSSPFDGLTAVGVDGTGYRKGHAYLTVVVDHERHRVIWAHDGVGGDVFDLFFKALTPVYLVKSVFRVSSLIFFGFRHEACRPVVCFTGCPSCRT